MAAASSADTTTTTNNNTTTNTTFSNATSEHSFYSLTLDCTLVVRKDGSGDHYTQQMSEYWQGIHQYNVSFMTSEIVGSLLPAKAGCVGMFVMLPNSDLRLPPAWAWVDEATFVSQLNQSNAKVGQLHQIMKVCDQRQMFMLLVQTQTFADFYYVCYVSPTLGTTLDEMRHLQQQQQGKDCTEEERDHREVRVSNRFLANTPEAPVPYFQSMESAWTRETQAHLQSTPSEAAAAASTTVLSSLGSDLNACL